MLQSFATLLLTGLLLGELARRLRLPPLVGMMLAGIAAGPHGLGWLGGDFLALSGDLRQMALAIILLRAGLGLDTADLRAVGRPALLMSFVPAAFEMAGVVLLAPPLLGLTRLEAALLGAVLAAVSPAVVVPRMLDLMARGIGAGRHVPQLVMAGASVDDVFVIVLFEGLLGLAAGTAAGWGAAVALPVSVVSGLLIGLVVGRLLGRLLSHLPGSAALVMLAAALLVLGADGLIPGLPVSGLVGVMAMGLSVRRTNVTLSEGLSRAFGGFWAAAEVLLFGLVGAGVDPGYAIGAGPAILALIVGALALRGVGVLTCLTGTALTAKERLFCLVAYLPKATVQAAIGGIALSMGLSCGPMVLAAAAVAILFTAPVGAYLIDRLHPVLLSDDAPLSSGQMAD